MPELPEVETVRRGLVERLEGRVLARVQQNRPDLRFPFPVDFARRLTGARVVRLDRRAKYILAALDTPAEGPMIWLIHLGMTGTVILKSGAAPSPPGKHDHLILETDDGGCVVYNDARRFGFMDLFPEAQRESHPLLREIGPEPLGNGFDAETLSQALDGRITPIKAALLDQKVVAGLGNIYVSEALFRAGISPKRSAHTVAGKRAERLVPVIRDVLNEAIEAGGSTLRDFRASDGELGYFQHRFKVYDREGQPCEGCDCDVAATGGIRRIVQSGRSSFYCPRRQR